MSIRVPLSPLSLWASCTLSSPIFLTPPLTSNNSSKRSKKILNKKLNTLFTWHPYSPEHSLELQSPIEI